MTLKWSLCSAVHHAPLHSMDHYFSVTACPALLFDHLYWIAFDAQLFRKIYQMVILFVVRQFAVTIFCSIILLMLWLSFFCRSLANACISASVIADGSCFITRSELLPFVPPLTLPPPPPPPPPTPPYVASNFNESASELDSNDKISSSKSSACTTKERERNKNDSH